MRTIIGTDKDHYLVYADWKSQEAVVQAYLSQDKNMIAAPSTAKELFDQVNKTLILRSKLNPDEIKTIDLLLEKSFSAGKKDE